MARLVLQFWNVGATFRIWSYGKRNPYLKHGRNLVGDTGDVSPPLFQTGGGHNMPCPPTFFSLGFVFGEISKIEVMFVTFCVKSFSC